MTLTLGKDKTVEITPWKAKTKKLFVKLFNGEKELSESDLVNTLILPNIDKPDAFYTSDEIQYILTQLKVVSIGDDVDFNMECEVCKNTFDIHLTIQDIVTFRPSNYVEADGIVWRDIPSAAIFKEAVSRFPDENTDEVEMLLHISSYNDIATTNFEQILETYNNLSIKESDALIDIYSSVRPLIELSSTLTCDNPECKQSDEYDFDVIPGFFDELMPN